jgi:pimeloyl-ACP methyl ester carboxylesterase
LRRISGADASAGTLFLEDPTLVIFGSTDGFTSARRLRGWAEKMSKDTSSKFEWHEVDGAGHFWREAGVMQDLQEKVAIWVKAQ